MEKTVPPTLPWPPIWAGGPSEGGDGSLLILGPECLEIPRGFCNPVDISANALKSPP